MKRGKIPAYLMVLVLAGSALAASADGMFRLVSDDEFERDQAARGVAAEDGRTAGDVFDEQVWTRAIDAPVIEVVNPNAEKPVPSPVDIFIRFAPGPGAKINLDSLRIKYGVIGLDVTDRIRKAATVSPEGIRATGAELPPGNHSMSIEIGDTAGRTTKQKFKFRVDG